MSEHLLAHPAGDDAPSATASASDALQATPARPWLHFPGTVTYAGGPRYIVAAVMLVTTTLLALVFTLLPLLFTPWWQPHRIYIGIGGLIGLGAAAGALQCLRVTRANRFEMHPAAVLSNNFDDCTVLPYTDIVGMAARPDKFGGYVVQLYSSKGVALTLLPRFEALEDERLLRWLQSIPLYGGTRVMRRPTGARF